MYLLLWLLDFVQLIEPVVTFVVLGFQWWLFRELNKHKRQREILMEQMFTDFVKGLAGLMSGVRSIGNFLEKFGPSLAKHFDNVKDLKQNKEEKGGKGEKHRDKKHKTSKTNE